MTRRRLACAVAAVSGLLVVLPASAGASVEHGAVVSDDPANATPVLVDTTLDGVALHVDAIDQEGNTLYAGGLFGTVANSTSNGGQRFDRRNLFAFDANTYAVSETFAPVVDGNVWAVEATSTAVYIGGEFGRVNGVSSPALAKLDPVTGAVDPLFDAGFTGGRIDDIQLVGDRLIVAGKNGQKLMALNPRTGGNTRYIDLDISGTVLHSRGGVTIFDFAVNPAGTQLIAVGNFLTVAGQPRSKFMMVDLTGSQATLNPWYYQPFAEPCATVHPRRVAYLQGVDYSPDGRYFVVTATGQIYDDGDRNKTVCDGAGRFNLSDDTKPAWINYTGGDSVWSTAVTGAAVYVQGHFSWLDNPYGFASKCVDPQVRDPSLPPCAARKGVGAIDPETGFALSWDPSKPARLGGKQFLATPEGLWIVSDSRRINGEQRYGLAFMPLP